MLGVGEEGCEVVVVWGGRRRCGGKLEEAAREGGQVMVNSGAAEWSRGSYEIGRCKERATGDEAMV